MRKVFFVVTAILFGIAPAFAAEGPSIAGPIGGTDIRSALLPPPGFYAGGIFVRADAFDFVDGNGQPIAALSQARLKRIVGAPVIAYVPNVNVLGGSIGFAAVMPIGRQCGRLFAFEMKSCESGLGDPYIEAMWSRSFGTVRPSRYPSALPIVEGLTIAFAFGAVIPVGQYDATNITTRALSTGNNIWDFAPSVAVTYTTPPILFEGTEFSAKAYLNNYIENPATRYKTGALVNIDFAISERIGRLQAGLAGFYAFQIADDKLFGVPVLPDGQQVKALSIGPLVSYDMPEYGTTMKAKLLRTIDVTNTANSYGLVLSFFKKL